MCNPHLVQISYAHVCVSSSSAGISCRVGRLVEHVMQLVCRRRHTTNTTRIRIWGSLWAIWVKLMTASMWRRRGFRWLVDNEDTIWCDDGWTYLPTLRSFVRPPWCGGRSSRQWLVMVLWCLHLVLKCLHVHRRRICVSLRRMNVLARSIQNQMHV